MPRGIDEDDARLPSAIGNYRLALPVQRQMSRPHALVAASVLVLIAGGGVAALFALGRGDEEPAGVSQRQEGSGSTTTPSEPEGGAFPIRFLLSESYETGATVDVVIENIGSRPYVFQSYYQACFLSYFDSSGALHHPARNTLRPAR
jgi:hypothetical protein